MGLFNKFKKKEKDDWKNAYMGNPNFYKGKDGKPFGAFIEIITNYNLVIS